MGVVSPNGGWVAYVDSDSGSNHVFVQPFPGPGPRIQVTHAPGTHPRWRADGRELFFSVALEERALESGVMSVDVAPLGDTLRVSAPRRIFGDAATDAMIDARRHADYTPDGERLLTQMLWFAANDSSWISNGPTSAFVARAPPRTRSTRVAVIVL